MQLKSTSIRNKLMVACAFVVAGVLATPAAFAQSHHDRRNHSADVIGALVVGAVIGGVLVSASQHQNGYYGNRYEYPERAYPPPPRYYGDSGYYRNPGYGSVNIGVVYTHRDNRWQGRDHRYYAGPHDYRHDRQVRHYPRHDR
ncbi:MAG TPA: hypothetical protein VFW60_10650 [Rhodanobacteraceae bacterium]|nr:hypothetical protein [Rhodanobacteraceae bacterium]